MIRGPRYIEHVLRRVGFGVAEGDADAFSEMTTRDVIDYFVDYDGIPDDVDDRIGQAGYLGVSSRPFLPGQNINDARQRWLFRMVHTGRPLQEKMALFWHNHFATGYSKVAQGGSIQGARYMAAKPTEDAMQVKGQIELFRERALGNFRDLLVAVAQDTAMLYWLDGRTNTRARPQENFGRELMELFTIGVGAYTEPDVYAAAKVFTGWNLRRVGATDNSDQNAYAFLFTFDANQHDTSAKTFSFPIYADGSHTIPARAASGGLQDGLDLIEALCAHPETGRRLARKLWSFFISDTAEPDADWLDAVAKTFRSSGYDMKPVVRSILQSGAFLDPAIHFTRYSWPAEFVARAIRELGWRGLSAAAALTPLANMGQTLFEPPNVAGWKLGANWISTTTMLARMNFAATLAASQRLSVAATAQPQATSPEGVMAYLDERFSVMPFSRDVRNTLLAYAGTGGWTGSVAQVRSRVAGLCRLIQGSAEYVFV